jgi:hypothetical protein
VSWRRASGRRRGGHDTLLQPSRRLDRLRLQWQRGDGGGEARGQLSTACAAFEMSLQQVLVLGIGRAKQVGGDAVLEVLVLN